MIVVNVLMISCQVSMLRMRMIDGAHSTTSKAQKQKNQARLATRAAPPANLSNAARPVRMTSLGITGGSVMESSQPCATHVPGSRRLPHPA